MFPFNTRCVCLFCSFCFVCFCECFALLFCGGGCCLFFVTVFITVFVCLLLFFICLLLFFSRSVVGFMGMYLYY